MALVGIKVVAMVSGQSVYSKLKYESGAHRVQRVPVTESQGRPYFNCHSSGHARNRRSRVLTLIQKTFGLTSTTHLVRVDRTSTRVLHSRSYRPLANQYQGRDTGRTDTTEEPRKGHEDHPCACGWPLCSRLPKMSKTLRESLLSGLVTVQSGSDLQLPSKPCDWSPDWLDPSKTGYHLIW